MSSPRGTYGGGYYAAPSFPDTPIYDSLVAERGTPQIAPIRVPSEYAYPTYETGRNLPALPAALPALPSGSSQYAPYPAAQGMSNGYPSNGYQPQPAPVQHTPAPYIPQQAGGGRASGSYNGFNGANGFSGANGYNPGSTGSYPVQQPQQQAPAQGGPGYDSARQPQRPAPRQTPNGYVEDPYQQRRPLGQGNQGYYQG
ncbi:DUF6643 family protein [Streptomyces sp. SPB162]|uniref:DUF6643 family protein n=1 Tax=Streptomyces sp. SPB162 TaxID=2940560 RepID=UPI0024070E98|nr:DUF6643 family protein [Streptomyces sp. SPB162]MDF9811852.1 hypothetical protein [Streptomyces sp. SPB162]